MRGEEGGTKGEKGAWGYHNDWAPEGYFSWHGKRCTMGYYLRKEVEEREGGGVL